ncbi:hypothetical protein EJD97_020970 [Solanum chilense]|uniref:Uncharacterized protein n=1 Tax=Solanum chilense TaxID=4083 RepID=A0A6N2B0B0_SOLCI|nr:hypothetical protein EJD97_020970 [Solanum chilense]
MSFLLNSLSAGHLSSRCPSHSEYSECCNILGFAPSLGLFAPTAVALTSLLIVHAFEASAAVLPLPPYFDLLPAANVLQPPI